MQVQNKKKRELVSFIDDEVDISSGYESDEELVQIIIMDDHR